VLTHYRVKELITIKKINAIKKMNIPYILAYKLQNLRQNLDLKARRVIYTRVIK